MNLPGLTAVVGLGQTGLSVACAVADYAPAAALMIVDSRAAPPGLAELKQRLPGVDVRLNANLSDPDLLAQAARLIVSPGVPVAAPAIAAASARGTPVWGDIELFARLCPNGVPVAAITGSNGKSTVTSLLGLMAEHAGLRVAVGGNLGPPALSLLRQLDAELYVLELSSFQLETTASLRLQAATVLNISADHLDRYPDLDAYAAAKQRIFNHCRQRVINADDPRVSAMANGHSTNTLSVTRFGLGPAAGGRDFGRCQRDGQTWLARGTEPWLAAAELRLPGSHNQANALAALALAAALGLPRSAMLAALREFPGLAHRSELVAEHNGVRWINDSKATNVGATIAAVRGIGQELKPPGRLIIIAGGDGKQQTFTPLGEALRPETVRALVTLGRDGPKIAAVLCPELAAYPARDMRDAVQTARRLAAPGDSVLLSPACASFDMFSDYQQRGQAFAAAVRELHQL